MSTRPIREVIASRQLVAAPRSVNVRDAARLMAEAKVGALAVVEADRLLGIFTERDALCRVLAEGRDPGVTTIGEVMTAAPITIGAERPLNFALHLMHQGSFRHLPVMEGARVIGMVSARDALVGELVEFEEELEHCQEIAEHLR
jgi:CBS domain-containing protein